MASMRHSGYSLRIGLVNPKDGMLSVGSVIRRKVRPSEADSSDQKRPRKKPLGIAIGKENVPDGSIPGDSADSKEYKQLLKERLSLQKQLDKMKESLESNKMELHKLTEAFRMEQLQNRQLAQANSRLLEELNSGRDRLKAIQHELACTRAMLKATCYEINPKQGTAVPLNVANKDEKPTKSPEVAPEEEGSLPSESTDTNQETSSGFTIDAVQLTGKKKKGNNRRKSIRRRSCILRGRPLCEPIGELFELKDIEFPIRSQRRAAAPPIEDSNHPTTPVIPQDISPPSGSELPAAPETRCKEEEEKHREEDVSAFSANRVPAGNSPSLPAAAAAASPDYQQADGVPRSLMGGRPARRAKVGVSYRELPLNVKMRREA